MSSTSTLAVVISLILIFFTLKFLFSNNQTANSFKPPETPIQVEPKVKVKKTKLNPLEEISKPQRVLN